MKTNTQIGIGIGTTVMIAGAVVLSARPASPAPVVNECVSGCDQLSALGCVPDVVACIATCNDAGGAGSVCWTDSRSVDDAKKCGACP